MTIGDLAWKGVERRARENSKDKNKRIIVKPIRVLEDIQRLNKDNTSPQKERKGGIEIFKTTKKDQNENNTGFNEKHPDIVSILRDM